MDSLATRTRSTETLRAYRQDLQRFEAFLKQKSLRVTQAKPSTIAEFIKEMSENHGRTVAGALAPATVARRLAVLSAFYDYLRDNSETTIKNPIEKVKRPKVQNDLPRAVEDQVLATLVEGITDLRDLAMVLVFLYSGLRESELRDLNKDTITIRRCLMKDGSRQPFGFGETVGKGGKRRAFMIGPKASVALQKYITTCRIRNGKPSDEDTALFLSSRKQRVSKRLIRQIVDKWCKRLGVSHIHVHQLRHSFATRNVNAGMSSTVLQELMGHANLNTTQRYFRVKGERVAREYFATMEFVNQTSPV